MPSYSTLHEWFFGCGGTRRGVYEEACLTQCSPIELLPVSYLVCIIVSNTGEDDCLADGWMGTHASTGRVVREETLAKFPRVRIFIGWFYADKTKKRYRQDTISMLFLALCLAAGVCKETSSSLGFPDLTFP